MRLSDFGVRSYSLNLIVNDAAWASPEKRAIARKIVEAVQEGYGLVNRGRAMPPRISRGSSPGSRRATSTQHRVGRPASPPAPVGGQTRQGWEDTINLLTSLKLLTWPVTVDEVAILE